MKIIFTRHGESYANVIHEISDMGLKHPLTRTGRQQANALAERLGMYGITRIFSSPTLRAIETTIIVAHRLDLDYEITEALREIQRGALEGRSDEAAWKIMYETSHAWIAEQDWDRRTEGGENLHDVRQRFMPFLADLERQYKETDEVILCVAHGGLFGIMLPLVLSNVSYETSSRYGYDHTCIIETQFTPAGLTCTAWNGVKI
jgi:broad specificity phosphatase PhoE